MYTVTFGGINLTEYFKVESIERSILPPKEVNLLEVPVRHGAYYSGSKYGVRKINLNITLIGDNSIQFMSKMRSIAFNLDLKAPAELILSDEPNKKYYAIIDDTTTIYELVNVGKGTLTFIVPDPFAYSTEEKVIVPTNNYFTFKNNGTTTTYPKFTVNFKKDATFVSFVSPDGVIMLGNPSQAEQIVLPKVEAVLVDEMYNLEGWNTYVSAGLDSTSTSDGTVRIVEDSMRADSFGTGEKWHGAAVRKYLPQTVKDFTITANIKFHSSDAGIAGLAIYLFDANGTRISKMSMYDGSSNIEQNIPSFTAGSDVFLLNRRKNLPISLWYFQKMGSKNLSKNVTSKDISAYNQFNGVMTLQRVGAKWIAEIANVDENGKKTHIYNSFYYDFTGKYPTGELSNIVVHFTRHSEYEPSDLVSVEDIKVYKHNDETTYDVPTIFKAGDVLEVDLQNSSVWLNGSPDFTNLDVGSTFFGIDAGTTEVKVISDDDTATYNATFTERFL